MNISNLRYLLSPDSVAVVGASKRPGSPGSMAILNMLERGYSGNLYPINPKYKEVHGIPCYENMAHLPEKVDCVIICVPAAGVPSILNLAVEAGSRSAIVYASGFAETGKTGADLQRELRKIAKRNVMPVCGPNCIGLVNFKSEFGGLSATVPPELHKGRVSAVYQSGSVAIALLNNGRGIEFNRVVSSGNEAVVTVEDYLEFFLEDEDTDVVLGFVEAFQNISKLRAVAAKARKLGKPIILLKVGQSSLARRTVASHTGRLAGSNAVLDALLKQCGIVRVRDLDELLETATLFLKSNRPRAKGLGMMAVSGGEIGMLADLADNVGLQFAPLAEETVEALRDCLPPYSSISNPLDAWGNGDLDRTYASALEILGRDPGIDLVGVSLDVQAGLNRNQAEFYEIAARSVVKVAAKLSKPVIVFSNISTGINRELLAVFESGGVPTLQGSEKSLRAISHLIDFSTRTHEKQSGSDSMRDDNRVSEAIAQFVHPRLSEHASKNVLNLYGIPTTTERIVSSLEEARESASEIGYPVVLKAVSPDLPHKTEADIIRLAIVDEASLEKAYEAIEINVRAIVPDESIDGTLVQEMLDLDQALEVIVGISVDPQCGPAVLFGLGGVFAEILNDVALRVIPISESDAWAMLAEIRGADLLTGVRGNPAVDRAAIVDILLKLSDLATELGNYLGEVDVNPLVVFPQGRGAIAADALIVTSPDISHTA